MAEQQKVRDALAVGGLAAILASTCCLGPLVLVAQLRPYRRRHSVS